MSDTFPQVRDQSTLTGVFQTALYLPIGVEGEMSETGEATVSKPETISTAEEATTAFGTGSSLAALCALILSRGIPSVRAVGSELSHELTARQAAWEALEDDPTIRIRLTDGVLQAELAALADSCEYAEQIENKQFMVGGLAAPTTKSALSTAADAIASKRGVLVGPGIYDLDGNLKSGADAAAIAACEIAKNPDIVDSLNLFEIPATAGIELEATTGLPLFRLHANAGSPIDDFQDLLDDGVSPFMTAPSGLAAFTHLRTTWTTDDTFDALMTLLIKDGVFIGIREMLLANNYHRRGNTLSNRSQAGAQVESYLKAHSNWVEPVQLPDGRVGYGVTVTASTDLKSFTVSYHGQVVRGTNVIDINGTLTIPA